MVANTNNGNAADRQDWVIFGLRWIFLIVATIAVIIAQQRTVAGFEDVSDLVFAVGIGAVIALIFWLTLEIARFRPFRPYVLIIGDVILAGIYTYIAGSNPMFVGGIASFLVVSGMLRQGIFLGSAHTLAVIIATVVALFLSPNIIRDPFSEFMGMYGPVGLFLLLLALTAAWWMNGYERVNRARQRQIKALSKTTSQQVDLMREQLLVVSEMANALSGTISSEKILDQALDVGPLALRKHGKKQRMVSIIMLFRPNETLYIANSRGLNFHDENRDLPGVDGVVGEALSKGVAVIGSNAIEDPELQTILAFQHIKSTLVIPLRVHFDNFGVLIFGTDVENGFNGDQLESLKTIGTLVTVALQNAELYGNLRREKDRIIELEEEGRKSLVRDLHDVPTQTISAVAMRLRIIMRLLERNPEEVMGELLQAEEMALRAVEELRHVLFKLRPLSLEDRGLSAAVKQLADKMQKTFNQAVAVRVEPETERYLNSHQQGMLFYLIEEAVNNARKYAQAELIQVIVEYKNGMVIISISDNGIGFDQEVAAKNERGSFGMINMRERAEMVDGTLEVKSVQGRGTTIRVVVPGANPDDVSAPRRPPLPNTKLAMSALDRMNG